MDKDQISLPLKCVPSQVNYIDDYHDAMLLLFFENDFMTKSNIKNIEYEGRSIYNVTDQIP